MLQQRHLHVFFFFFFFFFFCFFFFFFFFISSDRHPDHSIHRLLYFDKLAKRKVLVIKLSFICKSETNQLHVYERASDVAM